MGFLSKVNEKRKEAVKAVRGVRDLATGGTESKIIGKATSGLDSAFEDISGKTAENAIKEGSQAFSQGILEGSNLTADELIRGGDITAAGIGEGGRLASEGILEGSRQFGDTSRQGLSLLDQNLSPFANAFGAGDIDRLRGLATDPNQQASFVQNNPFFEALKSQAREDTFNRQSAGGALGSSGTDEILQNKFLAGGQALIDQQINRALPLLRGAQSAATNLGQGSANILSNIAANQNQAQAGSGRALGNAAAGQQGVLGNAIAGAGGVRGTGIQDAAQALATGQVGAAQAGAAGTHNVLDLLKGIGGFFA